ncbi:hypothetical protein K2X85_09390 [bacterium]|nr:hypothetical protein [bacterium]
MNPTSECRQNRYPQNYLARRRSGNVSACGDDGDESQIVSATEIRRYEKEG